METLTASQEKNDQNSIHIRHDKLMVNGSDMNTQPVYFINDEASNTIVIFNDLFIAAALLRSLGIRPVYDASSFSQRLTFFARVERFGPGERRTITRQKYGLVTEVGQPADILGAKLSQFSGLEESEEQFFDALEKAVQQSLATEETVNIALSGGIDSGTIAWLISQRHPGLKAYTVSTDWGDEYREAKETADFLSISLENIHISSDMLREELPQVIRYFGFIHPESIEIALVAHCLYKKLQERDPASRVFVTGYGSDLLNAGIFNPFENHDQLHAEILQRLRKTQWSNEFSNLSALCHGVSVRHPFWNSDVITRALRVPAKFKVVDGQDKFYFRNMMKSRLPDATVWRKKLGVHQGTGLSKHLQGLLGKPGEQANGKNYSDVILREHETIFNHGSYNFSTAGVFKPAAAGQ
jgi:asparagine synthetase B (glutamine-hydrolysing)